MYKHLTRGKQWRWRWWKNGRKLHSDKLFRAVIHSEIHFVSGVPCWLHCAGSSYWFCVVFCLINPWQREQHQSMCELTTLYLPLCWEEPGLLKVLEQPFYLLNKTNATFDALQLTECCGPSFYPCFYICIGSEVIVSLLELPLAHCQQHPHGPQRLVSHGSKRGFVWGHAAIDLITTPGLLGAGGKPHSPQSEQKHHWSGCACMLDHFMWNANTPERKCKGINNFYFSHAHGSCSATTSVCMLL